MLVISIIYEMSQSLTITSANLQRSLNCRSWINWNNSNAPENFIKYFLQEYILWLAKKTLK
jgi:hypothetical protein